MAQGLTLPPLPGDDPAPPLDWYRIMADVPGSVVRAALELYEAEVEPEQVADLAVREALQRRLNGAPPAVQLVGGATDTTDSLRGGEDA